MLDLEEIKARSERCQCGILDRQLYDDVPVLIAEVERLRAAVAEERAACAAICHRRMMEWTDVLHHEENDPEEYHEIRGAAEEAGRCEAAVRARGNK